MNVNVNLLVENVVQIKIRITINVTASTENIIYGKRIIFGIVLHVVPKNVKQLASITDDSVITCDKIIEEKKTIPTNFNKKYAICKTKNFYFLLGFLLITIALLIAVSISFYLIKYKSKQKQLLPYYVTNGKLKQVL